MSLKTRAGSSTTSWSAMRNTKEFCERILATRNFWISSTGKPSNGEMNMQGTITELGQSQAGKPKVKINGQWYSMKSADGISVGRTIDFEASSFEFRGKTYWGIDKWGLIPQSNGSGMANGGGMGLAPSVHVPTPMVQPKVAVTAMTGDELRFISNVVGSAIASGKIVDPIDLIAWTKGAQGALESLSKGSF